MVLCAPEMPRVNWEALGAIGEVLGGIVVIGTLFYLAVQMKHLRAETISSRLVQNSVATRELNQMLLSRSDLVVKANAALELDERETYEVARLYEVHEQHFFGRYGDANVREMDNAWVFAWLFARFLKRNPGFRSQFEQAKSEPRPGSRFNNFAQHVDTYLVNDLSLDRSLEIPSDGGT